MSKPPVIELRDAVVERKGRRLLEVGHLALSEGEHVAVLGPNGAGKSTLVRILARDVRPLAHENGSPAVLLRGEERWDIFEARKLLGIVSGDLQEVFERPVTVLDTILSGFFGSVGIHQHHRVTDEMMAKTRELAGLLGVARLTGRLMDSLSTGEARRALIARALVHDPAILVLDEPCDGLDPGATFLFLGTLRSLVADGRTIVMVTHHIDDILPEVERVVMLKDGRVLRDGSKTALLTAEALSTLYGIPANVDSRDGWYRLWGPEADSARSSSAGNLGSPVGTSMLPVPRLGGHESILGEHTRKRRGCVMPIVRIDITGPKPPGWKQSLAKSAREAIVGALGVPDSRVTVRVQETPDDCVDVPDCRTDRYTVVEVIMYEGRATEMKQAMVRAIRERFAADPGIEPSEVAVVIRDSSTLDLDVPAGEAGQ